MAADGQDLSVSSVERAEGEESSRSLWRRIGALGFLFFLVKGLLWLSAPVVLLLWQWLRAG